MKEREKNVYKVVLEQRNGIKKVFYCKTIKEVRELVKTSDFINIRIYDPKEDDK